MYKEYKQLNLPEIDKEIAQFWEENKIFEQSVEQRPKEEAFVFYEGPPSANGKPGIHHVMGRTVKDLFCRYHTLNGKRVERKGGWDTHGLPIELQVEKELGITKEDIGKKISVDDYNKACRETVMRYKDLWDDVTRKMGYWVDLDDPYITFENEYIETCWWLVKQLYEKKTPAGDSLLYKGFTIQPFSPAAGTGLSSHELNMPGTYKDVTDTTVIAMFKVVKDEKSAFLFDSDNEDVRIMAWTTTPWTLPSNVALTVGPNITYAKVKTFSPYTGDKVSVILARPRVETYFPKEDDALPFADYKLGDKKIPYNVDMANIQGEQLLGVRYEQLLPYVTTDLLKEKAFRVIGGDWVTTEDGTGVVHTAPYFGADDFRACKEAGVPYIGVHNEQNPDLPLPLVDRQGRFVAEMGDLVGRYVKPEYYPAEVSSAPDFKPTDLLIALKLKEENKAFRVEKYKHTYPHCWRTDKPVLYYPLDSWFVRASAMKERMAELNTTINWKPAHTGTGRFGSWLDNLQDWNLSRSRYWGVPLPIWRTEDGSEEVCVGSVEELQMEIEKSVKAGLMIGSTYVNLTLPSPKGEGSNSSLRPNGGVDLGNNTAAFTQDLTLPSPKGEGYNSSLRSNGGVDLESNDSTLTQISWEAFLEKKTLALTNPKLWEYLKPLARAMRAEATHGEDAMWELVRDKRFDDIKFRRQHAIGNFIVDFVALEHRLVVEIDGEIHNTDEHQQWDALRTEFLNGWGFEVIRFSNYEAINKSLLVKDKIKDAVKKLQKLKDLAAAHQSQGQQVNQASEVLRASLPEGEGSRVGFDLHRPYIDDVILVSPSGQPMRRELDLIDVWFDSGSMPYAQWGLDYEKLKNGDPMPFKTPFETSYPANFIAEGVDQTRGWFYTLHAISVMLFDKPAFLNVVSNGLVLDKEGNKMSKSKGNVVDPFETIASFGADATRWYLISNANPWDNLKFDLTGITEVRNKLFGTLYNTYNFFAMYANVDGWVMDEMNVMPYEERSELDRWILSKTYNMVRDYRTAMDDYEPTKAARLIETYVDEHLSNWYVRLSRRRFWRGEMSADKQAAYQTLHESLMVTTQLMASLAPFFSDWMYRNMTASMRQRAVEFNTPLRHTSVHLTDLVSGDAAMIDSELEKRMDYAQRICSLALSLRKGNKLRVRLPLQKLMLPVLDESFMAEVDGVKDLILSEINVKELQYITDESGLLTKKAKANFKTLGSRMGKDMKDMANYIAAMSHADITALERTQRMELVLNGTDYYLMAEDMLISTEDLPGWVTASDGNLTVALDITLTEALKAEGTARDLVNRIQSIRRDSNFDVTDRITVRVQKHDAITSAVTQFGDYIATEVLADQVEMVAQVVGVEVELEDEVVVMVEVRKV
jgi:isoleucyl-tRNA synthetase/very-short-patch-repair endonuclease